MKAFWSILFTVFFVALVLMGIAYLVASGSFYKQVSYGDFFLMALAIWRLVRLFNYDAITDFIREWLDVPNKNSFRGTLHTLMSCPWCAGLWFSFMVVFFYFATPFAWPIILILALAAVGSFLQVVSNLIGWNAEAKKRTVLGEGSGKGGTCG